VIGGPEEFGDDGAKVQFPASLQRSAGTAAEGRIEKLELRLNRARTTKDIDLRLTGSPETVLADLQEAGRPSCDPPEGPSHPIEVADLRAMHFEAIESPPQGRSCARGPKAEQLTRRTIVLAHGSMAEQLFAAHHMPQVQITSLVSD